MIQFVCHRCGWCCTHHYISVGYSDIVRWFDTGRYDILSEVVYVPKYNNYFFKSVPCSFLEFSDGKASCKIYSTRPRCCIDAPLWRASYPECPGFAELKISQEERSKIVVEQAEDYRLTLKNRDLVNSMLRIARRKLSV